jgi:exonuclease 1
MTSPLTPTYTIKSESPRRSLLSKSSAPFPDVERDTKPKKIQPASVPLPAPDEEENTALSMQSGSEDMIIHDSEEDEALSPSPGDACEPVLQLDLGRFAFVAKAWQIRSLWWWMTLGGGSGSVVLTAW